MLLESCKHLVDTALFRFKFYFSNHNCISLFFTWVNEFNCTCLFCKTSVSGSHLLKSLICISSLLNLIHKLTKVNEFITANLIVLIESNTLNITFGHLQITNTFCLCSVHCTYLTAKSFSKIFQTGTDYKNTQKKSTL